VFKSEAVLMALVLNDCPGMEATEMGAEIDEDVVESRLLEFDFNVLIWDCIVLGIDKVGDDVGESWPLPPVCD